jgi:phenylacetate-CoA ligase
MSSVLFNRRRILKNFQDLTISERWPSEKFSDLELSRLRSLLSYAYEFIPYYKEKFEKIGIVPSDVKKIADLSLLPPVPRQDVIEHHHQMVDRRYRNSAIIADKAGRPTGSPIPLAIFRKERVLRNTSSGSTGAPTVFYEDGSRTALNWTHELRLRSWFDLEPGSREARMARISTDYHPKNLDLVMRRVLWNQLILPGVNLALKITGQL